MKQKLLEPKIKFGYILPEIFNLIDYPEIEFSTEPVKEKAIEKSESKSLF